MVVASPFTASLSFSVASLNRTSSIPQLSRRNSHRSIVSALPRPYGDSSTIVNFFVHAAFIDIHDRNGTYKDALNYVNDWIFHPFEGLSSKTNGAPLNLDDKDFLLTSTSYGPILARKGNPPIMPAVMTPGGPLDLSSVLFRNRIIFIGQPVNSTVAQRVISQLVTLATIDEDADILVYLNCPGGSTYSVLAIYDCMSWIKPKVGTVCFGVAASQGALLLAGGEKGMRYAMPNSRIMIHQPQSGCGGHVEDVRRQVNEAVQSRHKVDMMYAAFTGQSIEKVQQYTERDRFLSVSEALEFGLIDGVLETEY